ncbi:hypothetical protein [Bacillus sp. FJAT-29814]|uniref:hypothetical protein n=1 Tax=Bacillus sp. FJAT-29814 TaxID=1729688 RepID=UPI00082DA19C|nr:hypothetical protein [Bacillus sp. FJAT-29814]
MKIKLDIKNIMLYYCLFLIIIPNDLYKLTSIYSFEKTSFIHYYLYSFHVSFLYFPVIIAGITSIFYKKIRYFYLLVLFFLMVFIKDIFLAGLYYHNPTMFFSWELYFQVGMSLCFFYFVFSYDNKENDKLWFVFSLITILGVYFAKLTGMGTGLYEFQNRYTAPNLNHGETSYIISIFVVYLLYNRDFKYKFVFILFAMGAIALTGSRKDLLYIFFFLILLVIKKNKVIIKKLMQLSPIKIYSIVLGFMIVVPVVVYKISTSTQFERIKEPFYYLFKGRFLDYIFTDSSGLGRLDSFSAAIEILMNYPLGLYFSFYNSQMQMQLEGYPTFAHSTLLFYTVILGVLIVPVLLFILYLIVNLIRYKSNFRYPLYYFIFYNLISGGALLNYKLLLLNIFLLGYSLQIVYKGNITNKKELQIK